MSKPIDVRAAKRCPIFGKPAVERYRPFCSRRCAHIDLNRWLSGVYAVPVVESEEDDAAERPDGEEKAG